MKRVFMICLAVLFELIPVYSQDAQTKMDAFLSKTGQIIRFIDYGLPSIKTDYEYVSVKIRQFEVQGDIKYFYQLSKESKYGTKTSSIEYSDLIEIVKAMDALLEKYNEDSKTNFDYMENKFSTEDGFQVGYYKSQKGTKWYMRLEKTGSDITVFLSDGNVLKSAFIIGKDKIESMKK
jgi:hypothetical protein